MSIRQKIFFFLKYKNLLNLCNIHKIVIKDKVYIYIQGSIPLIGLRNETIKELEESIGKKIKVIEFNPFHDNDYSITYKAKKSITKFLKKYEQFY